jgi:hypothetical protein
MLICSPGQLHAESVFRASLCGRAFSVVLLLIVVSACSGNRQTPAVLATSADPSACAPPAGEVLVIALGDIELVPGDIAPLEVTSSPHPSAFEALPSTCTVTWTVTPPGRGASIEATSGTLTIASDAAIDSAFEVHAKLADGRDVANRVRVVRRGRGSMVGVYREVSRVSCGGSEPTVSAHPIGELEFMGDGTFRATWVPFEVRYDYWGTYFHDPDQRTLTLRVTGGNYVPSDLDDAGTVVFEGADSFRLRDMWLGSASPGLETRSCQQTFNRIR